MYIINSYFSIPSLFWKNSRRQSKLEDFGRGLLPAVEGYSLERTDWNRIGPFNTEHTNIKSAMIRPHSIRKRMSNNNNNNNNNRIQRRNSRFFYNFLTAPRTVSNTYAQVARAKSCANHVQHFERLSRATCRVMCHVVRRDSSAIKSDRV